MLVGGVGTRDRLSLEGVVVDRILRASRMHLCHGSQRPGCLESVFQSLAGRSLFAGSDQGDHKGRDHGGGPVRLSSCELGSLWMMRGGSLGRGSWGSGLV